MKKIVAVLVFGACWAVIAGAGIFLIGGLIWGAIHGDAVARYIVTVCGVFLLIFGFVAAFAWAAEELGK